jgi:hypothetical protein
MGCTRGALLAGMSGEWKACLAELDGQVLLCPFGRESWYCPPSAHAQAEPRPMMQGVRSQSMLGVMEGPQRTSHPTCTSQV